MAKAIGTATIAFGLVSIPVKIFSAGQTGSTISFRQIDKVTMAPVKQKLVSSKDGSEVSRENIVKGYEISKNEFLLFSDEEIDSVTVASTKTIDIKEFVPLADVDPIFYDKAYYLAPDKGGSRPYFLIYEGLKSSGLCALAQYASRGSEHLVLLRADGRGLIMQQMHYAHEIKGWDELDEWMEPVAILPQELGLARQLISMNQKPNYDASSYEDRMHTKMLQMIQDKAEGKTITVEPEVKDKAPTVDLMAALQASLGIKS